MNYLKKCDQWNIDKQEIRQAAKWADSVGAGSDVSGELDLLFEVLDDCGENGDVESIRECRGAERDVLRSWARVDTDGYREAYFSWVKED